MVASAARVDQQPFRLMKRNRFIFFLAVVLIGAATEAAIPLNSLQTFDTLPEPANWATRTNGQFGISTVEAMDAAVQTNDISTLTNVLPVTAADGTSQSARWNFNARNILTRPAGISYISLLATVQNTSGKDLSSVIIGYDFGNPTPLAQSEDPGLTGWRAYYSLTGQPNTWSLIPEFTTGQTGSLAAVIMLGTWPQNSLLYLLWVDDNGSFGSDGSFTIDNFIAVEPPPPPPPPRIEPPGTNVFERQTIRLTAFANGYGLKYQWLKDGLAIDSAANPTATQHTLVITNARTSDSGQYSVVINTIFGGATADPVLVMVLEDLTPPTLLRAWEDPYDLQKFHLIVSEELCNDEVACGGLADLPFNWQIQDLTIPADYAYPEIIEINGTNLTFTMPSPRSPGQSYVVALDPEPLVTDLEGNRISPGSSIIVDRVALFEQGINGYVGTQDTELRGATPGVARGTNGTVRVDLEELGAVVQGMLRFDNLFGNAPGQVPPGALIRFAALRLTLAEGGSTVNLHRLLSPWDETTATYDLLEGGVQADGVEARVSADATLFSGLSAPGTVFELDVTDSVRAWESGQANYGWVLLPTGTDGASFHSSESATPPSLTIIYDTIVVDECEFSIQQQPAPTLTFLENQGFALSVSLSRTGLCLLNLQWTKDGMDIPGATSSTYSVNPAGLCHAGTYRVRIADSQSHSVTSNPAVVTMLPDISVPVLTRALASADGTNITLTFSKPMERTRAEDPSNFDLDPPVGITGASLAPGYPQIVLVTTGHRDPLVSYRLRVRNLAAHWWVCGGSVGNVILPNPTIVDLTGIRADVPWNTAWFYSTNSQDATLSASAPWYAPGFALTSDWKVGQGLFGEISQVVAFRAPAPIVTPLSPEHATSYFRRPVDLPELPDGATRALCHFIDDGAIFYLDGVEIGRVNMTNSPPVVYADRAAIAGEATLLCLPFTASPGLHTLAVEVHQAGEAAGPDMVFGLQILSLTEPPSLRVDTDAITWSGDSRWELVGAPDVDGPFAPLSNGQSYSLGTFYLWPYVQTNSSYFYRLRFHDGVR